MMANISCDTVAYYHKAAVKVLIAFAFLLTRNSGKRFFDDDEALKILVDLFGCLLLQCDLARVFRVFILSWWCIVCPVRRHYVFGIWWLLFFYPGWYAAYVPDEQMLRVFLMDNIGCLTANCISFIQNYPIMQFIFQMCMRVLIKELHVLQMIDRHVDWYYNVLCIGPVLVMLFRLENWHCNSTASAGWNWD